MLNKLTLMGRLCAEPELHATQSGIPVCTIRLAVERNYPNQDGKRETDFFDVVAWRGTAEFICKYFSKGRMIALDGRLQTRCWADRNGNRRVAVEMVTESAYFADSKPQNHGKPNPWDDTRAA